MIDGQAPVETFGEIDSTLTEARRRAERGELAPVWLIARGQTAGRGRRGRAWASLEGNLFATHLFATSRPAGELALLGFAAGLAIAEALEAFGANGAVTLKWPNDVMIDGAKTAGILIDSGALDGGKLWVALAFGVNVAAAPEGIDQQTTCLREKMSGAAAAPSPLEFFSDLRPRLQAWAERLAAEGFAPLHAAWLARIHGLGAAARVQQGAEALEGRILGLSPRGELELATATGIRLVAAGDVFLHQAA